MSKTDADKAKSLWLEEPENGIHPERIPKILQLLQDIATDTEEEVGLDNPLRQVIINTHILACLIAYLLLQLLEIPKDNVGT